MDFGWSTSEKVIGMNINPPKWTFSEDYFSALGCAAPSNFLHALATIPLNCLSSRICGADNDAFWCSLVRTRAYFLSTERQVSVMYNVRQQHYSVDWRCVVLLQSGVQTGAAVW